MIQPPCSETNSWAIGRPRPVPGGAPSLFTRKKRSNRYGRSLAAMPIPAVGDLHHGPGLRFHRSGAGRQAQCTGADLADAGDLPADQRILDGVVEQVAHDLAQLHLIAQDVHGRGRRDAQALAAPPDERPLTVHFLTHQRAPGPPGCAGPRHAPGVYLRASAGCRRRCASSRWACS